MWQELELGSELESDLRNTVDWGRKWLVNFNVEKTQWKMDVSVPVEKSSSEEGLRVHHF